MIVIFLFDFRQHLDLKIFKSMTINRREKWSVVYVNTRNHQIISKTTLYLYITTTLTIRKISRSSHRHDSERNDYKVNLTNISAGNYGTQLSLDARCSVL